jgi:hypothetical protein
MRRKTSRSEYIKRFWSYVKIGKSDECWPYTRWCGREGYGQYYANGKRIQSNRFAYETKHGEGSADGLLVLHKCDNPSCCNPRHLFKGTHLINMRDKERKGRSRYIKGDECSWTKLTDADVKIIKQQINSGMKQADIARQFSVTPSLITYIKNGKTRKHVE